MGAGPVGLISALHALHAGHEVHIFSVDDKRNSSTANNWPEELKSGKGQLTAYGEDLETNIHSLRHLFIESKIRGGFANVWGATWGRFPSLESPEWISAYEQVDRYVWSSNSLGRFWTTLPLPQEFQCSCFHIPTLKIKTKSTSVAKVASLAILNHDCDCIANGFSVCDHGSIFDTSDLLSKCQKFDRFRIFESVRIDLYTILNSGVELQPNVNNSVYDKVVLAAGPIANAKIIVNSEPSTSQLTIQDNSMIYVPLINLFRKRKHLGSFAFSQIQISSSSRSSVQFHQQIYAHPELFLDRIATSVPIIFEGIVRKLLKIASGRFNIGIVYLDQQISPQVSLTRDMELAVNEAEKKLTRWGRFHLHYDIWKNFIAVGFLWFWPISKKGLPGASFHVGALKERILDEYGQVLAHPNVGVAGSLALERLEPGPITNTSMAQAIRLLEKMM